MQSVGEGAAVFAVLAGVCIASFLILASALLLPLPFAILVPAPLVYIAVKRGYAHGLFLLFLMAALFWLMGGTTAAFLFLALFSPPLVAVSYALLQKKRTLAGVAVSTAAFAAGVGIVVAYVYFALKTDVISLISGYFENYVKANPGTARQMLYLFNLQDILTGVKDMNVFLAMPETQAQQAAVSEMRASLTAYLPGLLAEYTLLAGLLNYVVARAVLKKRGVAVSPIPAFSDFRLPKGFFVGMAGVALVLLGAYLANLPGFPAVRDAVVTAYMLVFLVSGLSLIDYLLKRRNVAAGARVAVLAVVTALFYSSWALALMGLFESVLKLKDRLDKPFDPDGL